MSGNRNYNIDNCKVVLAFFVVCIHFLPSSDYVRIQPFASCSVAIFYIISGYYILGDKCVDRVKETIKRMFNLTLIWGILYLLYDNLYIERWRDFMIYSPQQLVEVLVFNRFAHGYHLWYLSSYYYALIFVLIIYKFNMFKYRYGIALALLIINLVFGYYSKYILGEPFPFFYIRNGLCWALPMLIIGNGMKQVNLHVVHKYRYLILLFLILYYVGNAIGIEGLMPATEIPNIQTIIISIILFIFVLSLGKGRPTWFSEIGRKYSLYIYIYHMFFFPLRPIVEGNFGIATHFLPIFIYILSLFLSVVTVSLKNMVYEKNYC